MSKSGKLLECNFFPLICAYFCLRKHHPPEKRCDYCSYRFSARHDCSNCAYSFPECLEEGGEE